MSIAFAVALASVHPELNFTLRAGDPQGYPGPILQTKCMKSYSATSSDEGLRRISSLDGIRGLAILMVMLFHSSAWFPLPKTARFDEVVDLVVGGGWAGVHLFFVLSGFLITGILISAKNGKR